LGLAWKPPIPQHTLGFQVTINQDSIELSGNFGVKFWLGLGLEQEHHHQQAGHQKMKWNLHRLRLVNEVCSGGVGWCGVVWCGVMWSGVEWYGVV
jgi:hypothetical protein